MSVGPCMAFIGLSYLLYLVSPLHEHHHRQFLFHFFHFFSRSNVFALRLPAHPIIDYETAHAPIAFSYYQSTDQPNRFLACTEPPRYTSTHHCLYYLSAFLFLLSSFYTSHDQASRHSFLSFVTDDDPSIHTTTLAFSFLFSFLVLCFHPLPPWCFIGRYAYDVGGGRPGSNPDGSQPTSSSSVSSRFSINPRYVSSTRTPESPSKQ